MPAEVFLKVFRAVTVKQKRRIAPEVVVNFLAVADRVVTLQIEQEQIQAGRNVFQKGIAVHREQEIGNVLFRNHRQACACNAYGHQRKQPVVTVNQVQDKQNDVTHRRRTRCAGENNRAQTQKQKPTEQIFSFADTDIEKYQNGRGEAEGGCAQVVGVEEKAFNNAGFNRQNFV